MYNLACPVLKTKISLHIHCIHCAESSQFVLRVIGALATLRGPSKDSDQAGAHANLSPHWAHIPNCTFCYARPNNMLDLSSWSLHTFKHYYFLLCLTTYKPSILFMGHHQTMQNQIRCHNMWHLIRFCAVCSTEYAFKV